MRLKASYTVEAAVIISFSFIVFGMAVGVVYEVFQQCISYPAEHGSSFDAVQLFRLKEALMGVINAVKD